MGQRPALVSSAPDITVAAHGAAGIDLDKRVPATMPSIIALDEHFEVAPVRWLTILAVAGWRLRFARVSPKIVFG